MDNMIEMQAVKKAFNSDSSTALVFDNFSLRIRDREFLTVLGPSGCGKTTLLRIIAGLDYPDEGQVLFDGEVVGGPNRDIGFIFQSYDCFPWKTVFDNVALALANDRLPTSERLKRIRAILDRVGLAGFESAMPYELSGGMRQRVALARTLVPNPKALMMDEPFGALDALMREELQAQTVSLFETGVARVVVFVTHDVLEAVSIGTRVIVLSQRPARVLLDKATQRGDTTALNNHELIKLCREALAAEPAEQR